MAIWQWSAWLVPQVEIDRRFSVTPSSADMDWFESINWWSGLDPEPLTLAFDKMLPPADMPWAEYTVGWGSVDRDIITVMIEDGAVTDLSVRIDLSKLDLDLVSKLVAFAQMEKMVFLPVDTLRFVKADMDLVISEMRASRSWKFVQDPRSFFDDKEHLESIQKSNANK